MNAILLCCDNNYLGHAAALLGSLDRQKISPEAQRVLIVDHSVSPNNIDFLRRKNIEVVQTHSGEHGYHLKYQLFDPQFAKYDKILYLDIDMSIVRSDIDVFANFNGQLEVDYEPFTLLETLISAAPELNDEQRQLIEQSVSHSRMAWNSGGMLYRGHLLSPELSQYIQDIRRKYRSVNYHVRGVQDGSDQPILNIALDHLKPARSSLFAYWKNVTDDTVFAHCCADPNDRPWKNPLFVKNYILGLEHFHEPR